MDSLDYLRLLEDETTRDAALRLVVALIASDGVVHDDELLLLTQLEPRRAFDAAWVRDEAARPLDLDALGRAFATEENRWRALRLAARVAWTDKQLASEEKRLLVDLAAAFALPTTSVEDVLLEMVGTPGGSVDEAAVRAALAGMVWEELEFAKRGPRSSLAAVAPAEDAIGVLAVEGLEVAAVYPGGLLAGFREGDAFVRWSEIDEYTRIPVFGAAVRVETRDGRTFTLVDVRLRPLAALLDRVFARSG